MNRVIVIGGGSDALVAVQILARAGREVILIEGARASEEEGWMPPAIAAELRLEEIGRAHV